MIGRLSYFFVAVLIIVGAKVLQLVFDEGLERYGENKKKMKKQAVEQVKEFSSKANEKAGARNKPLVEKDQEYTEADTAFNKPDTIVNTYDETNSFGEDSYSSTLNDDGAYFQNLINSYLNPIVAGLPEGRARDDVTIRYYMHEKDGDHVYALRNLGYYLHEKEATETKGFESNVLIYGSDVDVRDIHIVAYTLLQNEVPLKGIRPSQYEWKFHALEIGTNPELVDEPLMTPEDIRNFTVD